MKATHILLISILLSTTLFSCADKIKDEDFHINLKSSENKIHSGDEIELSIAISNAKATIDSVRYSFGKQFLKTAVQNKTIRMPLVSPLGNHELVAEIFVKGKKFIHSKEFVLHTDKQPILYGYKIINTYPHDPKSFTQGLEFYQDTLYEGTGQYGRSVLRKLDYKTGEIYKETKLDQKYFGEGITILNDALYQLTWREETGFIYNPHTLKKIKDFKYGKSLEGWGLCNDGEMLYKSDGSEKIWILDPETLEEKSYIQPVTKNSLANSVNEMEFIDGKIYANTWQKDGVLIINPQSGAVEGLVDFRGLKNKLGNRFKADVLNGIAYNPKTNTIFVTGKYWDKLFEVEIVKK